MQGPVSFSDMGIRPVNALRVMQYRRVPGVSNSVCTNTHNIVYVTADGNVQQADILKYLTHYVYYVAVSGLSVHP